MSEDRYCGCPYCEAIFKLPENTFQHRGGIVRCGACREVFDSSMNLVIRSNGKFIPVATVPPIVESRSDQKEPRERVSQKPNEPHAQNSNSFDSEQAVTRHAEADIETSINTGETQRQPERLEVTRELHTDDLKNPFDESTVSPKREVKTAENGKANTKKAPSFSPLNLDQSDSDQFIDELSESISHRLDSRISSGSESPPLMDDVDSERNMNLVTAQVTPQYDSKLSVNSEMDSSVLEESQFSGMRRERAEQYIRDRRNPLFSVLWFLVAAGFLFLLSVQVKYFLVDEYAQDDKYRGYLSLFCQVASCDLPAKRDPFKFTLTHTKIDLHPTQPDAIRVTVKLINEAEFSQPYPDLQLTLTDRDGRVVGRRTFPPKLYLSGNSGKMLGKGELASILFDLSHPHEKAVGFVIDIVDQSES